MARQQNGNLLLDWQAYNLTIADSNAAQLVPAASLIAASTLTNDGCLCTFTSSGAHGFFDGQRVTITGATETKFNGDVVVILVSATVFNYYVPAAPTAAFVAANAASLTARTALVQADAGNTGNLTIGPDSNGTARTLIPGAEYQIPQLMQIDGRAPIFDLAKWYYKGTAAQVIRVLYVSCLIFAFCLFFLTHSALGQAGGGGGGGYSPPPASLFSQGLFTNTTAAGWTNALGIGSGGGGGSQTPLTNNINGATYTISNASFTGNGAGLTNISPNLIPAGSTMVNKTSKTQFSLTGLQSNTPYIWKPQSGTYASQLALSANWNDAGAVLLANSNDAPQTFILTNKTAVAVYLNKAGQMGTAVTDGIYLAQGLSAAPLDNTVSVNLTNAQNNFAGTANGLRFSDTNAVQQPVLASVPPAIWGQQSNWVRATAPPPAGTYYPPQQPAGYGVWIESSVDLINWSSLTGGQPVYTNGRGIRDVSMFWSASASLWYVLGTFQSPTLSEVANSIIVISSPTLPNIGGWTLVSTNQVTNGNYVVWSPQFVTWNSSNFVVYSIGDPAFVTRHIEAIPVTNFTSWGTPITICTNEVSIGGGGVNDPFFLGTVSGNATLLAKNETTSQYDLYTNATFPAIMHLSSSNATTFGCEAVGLVQTAANNWRLVGSTLGASVLAGTNGQPFYSDANAITGPWTTPAAQTEWPMFTFSHGTGVATPVGLVNTSGVKFGAITATGWTNTLGYNAVVYLTGTAITFTNFDNAGSAYMTNTTLLNATMTLMLQPNAYFKAASGLSGTYHAF